jgi:hypothetical protein
MFKLLNVLDNGELCVLGNDMLRIGCSFKCIFKVDVEESIVNAPQIADHRSAI